MTTTDKKKKKKNKTIHYNTYNATLMSTSPRGLFRVNYKNGVNNLQCFIIYNANYEGLFLISA